MMSSGWYPIILLIGCGTLISTQATLNATLGRGLGLPFFTVVFSLIQLLCTLPVLLMWGWPPRAELLTQTPWWHYIGAVLGVVLLAGMSFGLSRAGTFAGTVGLLLGQLSMGMVIDQFGLFGAAVHPINASRVFGLLLVLGGVWLTRL